MMKVDRLYFGIMIVVTINLALLGVALYALYLDNFYINPAIEFRNIPFPTDKAIYYQGDDVRVLSNTCTHTDLPATLYVDIIDGVIESLPPIQRGGGSVGCSETWVTAARIPANYPPSERVKLSGRAQIELNSFTKRTSPWESEYFAVRAR